MLPPGLGFNAVSQKALATARAAKQPKSYFAWDEMLPANKEGFFPYTPATNSALRSGRGHRHAARGGARARVCASRPSCGGLRAARSRPGASRFCAKTPGIIHSSLTAVLLAPDQDARRLAQCRASRPSIFQAWHRS